MNQSGGGFAAPASLQPRRARLPGRPSGLKGRYRDRCATDRGPALDPGASAALNSSGTGRRRALPAQRAALNHEITTNQSLRFQGIANLNFSCGSARRS